MFHTFVLAALAQEQLQLPSQTTTRLSIQVQGREAGHLELHIDAAGQRYDSRTDESGLATFVLPVETAVDIFIGEHLAGNIVTPEAGYNASVPLSWPPGFTIQFVELDAQGEIPPRDQRRPLVGQDIRIEPTDGGETRTLTTDKTGRITVDWLMPGQSFELLHIPPLGEVEDGHRWPRPMDVTGTSQERIVGYTAGYSLRLEHMNFALGKASFAPETRDETHAYLDQQARELVVYFQHHPERLIEVQGHTDATGSEEANQRLSQARANTVAARLIAQGVPEDRVRVVGKGETMPTGDNETDEGRALNRRVELHFVDP
jgi:outer membrane protein OmpA-like peptidoglycan-associated protein